MDWHRNSSDERASHPWCSALTQNWLKTIVSHPNTSDLHVKERLHVGPHLMRVFRHVNIHCPLLRHPLIKFTINKLNYFNIKLDFCCWQVPKFTEYLTIRGIWGKLCDKEKNAVTHYRMNNHIWLLSFSDSNHLFFISDIVRCVWDSS